MIINILLLKKISFHIKEIKFKTYLKIQVILFIYMNFLEKKIILSVLKSNFKCFQPFYNP
jgi:hypothetical protein